MVNDRLFAGGSADFVGKYPLSFRVSRLLAQRGSFGFATEAARTTVCSDTGYPPGA